VNAHARSTIIVSGLALFVVLAGAPAATAQEGYGALAGLRSPFGTAALSYGNAFTAIADDPTAVVYNPAGPAQIARYDVVAGSGSHGSGSFAARSQLDFGRPYAALTLATARAGTFSALWRHFGVGDIEERLTRDGPTGGSFNYNENWLSLGWSYAVIPHDFFFGASFNYAKMGYSLSSGSDGSAAGFSVGVLYTGVPLLRLGAAVESDMTLNHDDGRKDKSPGRGRGGVAVGPMGGLLTLALDLEQISQEPLRAHAGARVAYEPAGSSTLRSVYAGGGVMDWALGDRGSGLDTDKERHYTGGVGVTLGFGRTQIEVGYAIMSSRFGLDHTLSLSLQGAP
jgi:hypothetical protein